MQSFRRRRGVQSRPVSYANVVSTLALILAVGGGSALAATGGSTSKPKPKHHYRITSVGQIAPDVRSQLKGANGKNGSNGTNGTNGAMGPTGQTGPAGPSTGPAGGALAGTYPNPTLAAGAVSDNSIAAATQSVAEAGGTVTVSGTTPTLQNSFDRLGGAVSVARVGAGMYNVTIPNLSFFFSHEITQITPLDTGPGFVARIDSVSGMLQVRVFDLSGALVDSGFSFVVYD